MKDIVTKINESKEQELIDNAKAIASAIICLNDDNGNYSLELKTRKINPTLSENDVFKMAENINEIITDEMEYWVENKKRHRDSRLNKV